MVAACSALGSARSFCSTDMIAPPASFCITWAMVVALMPSLSKASRWLLVADSPEARVSSMFLMPVAETSDSIPIPATVAPRAARGPLCRPATSPRAPMRFTTALILLTLAGPVLPR